MNPSPLWLPGIDIADEPEFRHVGMTAAGATFWTPDLSAEEAAGIADRARRAALTARKTHGMADVIPAIARAALRLADPADAIGTCAVAALQTSGGWPLQTAKDLLAANAAGWSEECLTSLVRSELGDVALLDGPQLDLSRPGRSRQASGPPALFFVLAGNVPGVAVTAVIRGLLVRSAVLCKLPADEPDLVGLFARALNDEDPALAETIAATWWPADNPGPALDEWTKRCGKVIVYGGEDAVSQIRLRTPADIPMVEYGPKLGVACLGAATTDAELGALARDVCAYDQAGCVSPRLVFLLGKYPNGGAVQATLDRLAVALGDEAARLSGSRIRDEEAVAIRAARARYQFAGDEGTLALGADDLTWTLLYRDTASAWSESLPRVVSVYRISTMSDLRGLAAVLEGRVQAMGIAGLDPEQRADVDQIAVEWGVSRVVPTGEMAWPPPDWRHDGAFQLLPLLRWTEFE